MAITRLNNNSASSITSLSAVTSVPNLASLPSGLVTSQPAFSVELTTEQSVSSDVVTRCNFNTTHFDTHSGWNGTDYKWTVPTGEGGKYIINLSANAYSPNNNIGDFRMELYKNGSRLRMNQFYSYSDEDRHLPHCLTDIFQLNAGDYLQCYLLIQATSPRIRGDGKETFMSGFRVIE